MKAISRYIIALITVAGFSACTDQFTEEMDMNVPVYLSYETLRASVRQSSARDLVNPGKICFKDNYLLVVEHLEGVHVLDVSNPASPQNKAFIEIPGCVDIAMKDQLLYADNYVDLIALDISDLNNVKESARLEAVFPYTLPPFEKAELPCASIDQKKGIITGWKIKREKREIESAVNYPIYAEKAYGDFAYASLGTSVPAAAGASFGKSGSMARFGLYDHYLYCANEYVLQIIDISGTPVLLPQQYLNYTVETMFIHDGHMFFGAPVGMLIYSLEVPTQPNFIYLYSHITSCDPVVVQDHYAYITLRGGVSCHGDINQLDVVKLSNTYTSAEQVGSVPMAQPYGLGIDGNTLFVCDGAAGLKVYDVTDKKAVGSHLLATFPGIQTYDVIPVNNYLFMIGKGGFYLYDYKDITAIRLLGHIPVVAPE
jgi:hypothetical protein